MNNYKHGKGQYYCDGYVHYEWETYDYNGKFYVRYHQSGDGYDYFEDCPVRAFDTAAERDAFLEF